MVALDYMSLPIGIWRHEGYTPLEKFIFGEIYGFRNSSKGCYLSNKEIAKRVGSTEKNVSKVISKFVNDGLLINDIRRNESKQIISRNIYLNMENGELIRILNIYYEDGEEKNKLENFTLVSKKGIPSPLESGYPPHSRVEDKYKVLNINNKKDNMSSNEKDHTFKEVIDYLNAKANKKFRYVKKSESLVNARLKEGFTKEDFFKVIDIKVKEWLYDPKMNQYLRPETLFSTKFEGYLNTGSIKVKKQPYQNQTQMFAATPIKQTVTKSINQFDLFNAGEE